MKYLGQKIGVLHIVAAVVFLFLPATPFHILMITNFLIVTAMLDVILIWFCGQMSISNYIRFKLGFETHHALWLIFIALILLVKGWYIADVVVIGFLTCHFSVKEDADIPPTLAKDLTKVWKWLRGK